MSHRSAAENRTAAFPNQATLSFQRKVAIFSSRKGKKFWIFWPIRGDASFTPFATQMLFGTCAEKWAPASLGPGLDGWIFAVYPREQISRINQEKVDMLVLAGRAVLFFPGGCEEERTPLAERTPTRVQFQEDEMVGGSG